MTDVYKVGTKVCIKRLSDEHNDIAGMINEVNIGGDNKIMYNVVWWSDSTRHTAWLYEHEIIPVKVTEKTQIGFVT